MKTYIFPLLEIEVREDGMVRRNEGAWFPGTRYVYLKSAEVRHHIYSYITKTVYRVHRLIAEAFVWNPSAGIFNLVDHIDGNTENNAASNLRYLSCPLNGLNQKRARNTCYSKGYFCKKYLKWRPIESYVAKVSKISLGSCKKEEDAFELAQAFKELLFRAIYLSSIPKDNYVKAEERTDGYLHASKLSFAVAARVFGARTRRPGCCRKALQQLRDLLPAISDAIPTFVADCSSDTPQHTYASDRRPRFATA